jgi:hypothetical protein
MTKIDEEIDLRNNRCICLPFNLEEYNQCIEDASSFRKRIDNLIQIYPEIFPSEIANGYQFKDSYISQKLNIKIRRIKIANVAYSLRPSFILPYMTGTTDFVSNALFFRKFGVPYWALSHAFGKNPMYWYRKEQSIGMNSIVGTTIRNTNNIPKHIAADEKHTTILGDKIYVATTVGGECILGAQIALESNTECLSKAYGVFKAESQNLNPEYKPETVNIDGWKSTHNAWLNLFNSIVIICCFLHIFIKIRDRGKKKYQEVFQEVFQQVFQQVSSKLWDSYRAQNKSEFGQRIRRLVEWCEKSDVPEVFLSPLKKIM